VAVQLIKHRPVPRWASADLLRDFFNFLALVRHLTMSDRAPGISYVCGERCVQSQVLPTFANRSWTQVLTELRLKQYYQFFGGCWIKHTRWVFSWTLVLPRPCPPCVDLKNLTSLCLCGHKQNNCKVGWQNIKKWQSCSQYCFCDRRTDRQTEIQTMQSPCFVFFAKGITIIMSVRKWQKLLPWPNIFDCGFRERSQTYPYKQNNLESFWYYC